MDLWKLSANEREFFADWPIIDGPVWCQPAFEHGFDVASPATAAEVVNPLRFVVPMNLLGFPAAAAGACNSTMAWRQRSR